MGSCYWVYSEFGFGEVNRLVYLKLVVFEDYNFYKWVVWSTKECKNLLRKGFLS